MSTRTARDPILPGISVAIVGGNCNNGANCGARYLNLNNDAGNANWNIGASPALKGYLKTYSSEWLSPCFVAGLLAEVTKPPLGYLRGTGAEAGSGSRQPLLEIAS